MLFELLGIELLLIKFGLFDELLLVLLLIEFELLELLFRSFTENSSLFCCNEFDFPLFSTSLILGKSSFLSIFECLSSSFIDEISY
mgnify:FL=1